VSQDELLAMGQVSGQEFEEAAAIAARLFAFGQARAAERGLILADTKYELGVTADGQVIVIDEIHTPDSSRYWYADDYEARLAAGAEPRSLDKEYVRRYLAEEAGYRGDGPPPPLPRSRPGRGRPPLHRQLRAGHRRALRAGARRRARADRRGPGGGVTVWVVPGGPARTAARLARTAAAIAEVAPETSLVAADHVYLVAADRALTADEAAILDAVLGAGRGPGRARRRDRALRRAAPGHDLAVVVEGHRHRPHLGADRGDPDRARHRVGGARPVDRGGSRPRWPIA
jgi:hypothetical protein